MTKARLVANFLARIALAIGCGVIASCAHQTDKSLAYHLVWVYQTDLSPIDGPRSGSYPTGSAYGLEAYDRYGFLVGTTIIAARLLQEYDAPKAGYVELYLVRRKFDPLLNNVYWWDEQALAGGLVPSLPAKK